ncbi:hypothetical protein AB0B92_14235 [Streptomyces hygroscopicus]|uniref:hypothetical protein n=1 Tax=Streptomyces hygroscopicus TaxID=1912 RepID=UPI0033D81A72
MRVNDLHQIVVAGIDVHCRRHNSPGLKPVASATSVVAPLPWLRLLTGTAVALALTIPYLSIGGAVPWLGGFRSGLVGLIVSLLVHVLVSRLRPSDPAEPERVTELCHAARARTTPPATTGARAGSPEPVTGPF